MQELMKVDGLNAVSLFEKQEVGAIVVGIQKQVRTFVPDVDSDKGRKSISDMDKQVGKCIKVLDDLGKNHVAMLKALPKQIDNQRKSMRDDLGELRVEVRKPLTDWEDAEKAKQGAILDKITAMMAMPLGVASSRILDRVSAELFLVEIEATEIDDSFGDSIEYATKTKAENALIVKGVIATFKAEELAATEAESKRLEAEQSEREAREALIAKEATEQAERDAATAISNAKIAEETAKQNLIDANKAKDLAEVKATQDAIAANERAEKDAKQAIENAKLRADKAVQDEKDRAERERLAEVAKQEKLAANKKHSAKVNNEVVSALMKASKESEHTLTETQAKLVVIMIAKGTIPHVSITY